MEIGFFQNSNSVKIKEDLPYFVVIIITIYIYAQNTHFNILFENGKIISRNLAKHKLFIGISNKTNFFINKFI